MINKENWWLRCTNRPTGTVNCLIAYSDGVVVTGLYVTYSGFDKGGFFSSLKDFDSENLAEPVYWMPIPVLPEEMRLSA